MNSETSISSGISSAESWRHQAKFVTAVASGSTFVIGARGTGFATLAALVAPNAVVVGLISAASVLPWLIFGPWMGHAIDKVEKASLMRAISVAGLLVSLLIAFVMWTQGASWILLLATAGILGTAQIFLDTTVNSLLVEVVPDQHLARSNGIMSAWQGTASVISPAVAAAVIGYSHALFAILLAAAFGGIAFLCLPLRGQRGDDTQRSRGEWKKMQGIRLLARSKPLLALCSSVSIMNLYTGVLFAMLPLLILSFENSAPHQIGVVFSIQAVAMLTGVWGASRLINSFESAGRVLLLSSTVIKVGVFAIALLSTNVWMIFLLAALNGISAGFWNAPSSTAMLRLSSGPYRSHIIAAYKMFASLGLPFGAVIGGMSVGALGMRSPYLIGLALAVLVCILVATKLSKFKL